MASYPNNEESTDGLVVTSLQLHLWLSLLGVHERPLEPVSHDVPPTGRHSSEASGVSRFSSVRGNMPATLHGERTHVGVGSRFLRAVRTAMQQVSKRGRVDGKDRVVFTHQPQALIFTHQPHAVVL
ncbi:hypothetical protein EYF80_026360 [Liparis tanakae]|uniref:Uncharacterized protein n=1 Tax=Liparis tanakae TaxID=230148 RepID=A0A4Z2HER7_9TELE|nr:hypothetical protein EYF80_026360 [Liparis tanakae]